MCVQHPHKLPSIYWGYLANIYCRQIWRGRSGKDSRSDTEMALCSRRRYPPICPYRYLRNNKKAMEQWSDGATEKRAQLSCWFLRIWRGRPFPLFFFRNPPAQQLNLLRFWMELVPSGSQMGRRVMKNYTGHFIRLSTRLLRYSNFWSVKNIRLCMEIHTDFYGTYTWICKQIMAAFGRHIFLSFPHWVQLSWVGQNKGREQEIDNSLAQKFVAKQKNATKKKKRGEARRKFKSTYWFLCERGVSPPTTATTHEIRVHKADADVCILYLRWLATAAAAVAGFSGAVNVCQLVDRAFACSQLLFIYGLIFIYFPPHLFCQRFCHDTSAFPAAPNGFCVRFQPTGLSFLTLLNSVRSNQFQFTLLPKL